MKWNKRRWHKESLIHQTHEVLVRLKVHLCTAPAAVLRDFRYSLATREAGYNIVHEERAELEELEELEEPSRVSAQLLHKKLQFLLSSQETDSLKKTWRQVVVMWRGNVHSSVTCMWACAGLHYPVFSLFFWHKQWFNFKTIAFELSCRRRWLHYKITSVILVPEDKNLNTSVCILVFLLNWQMKTWGWMFSHIKRISYIWTEADFTKIYIWHKRSFSYFYD